MVETKEGINWLIETLRNDQSHDGSWNYPFDTGISTDAYMIILLRSLEIDEEELIKGLCKRILSKQTRYGTWKLFYDEGKGNVTATLEAYYALLYSGYYSKTDKRLELAKKFIKTNGGIEAVSIFTKIMLAITGQYKWPNHSPLPIEMILLPPIFPINFFSFSIFGRANLTPIMILAAKNYSLKTVKSPVLTDLVTHRNIEDPWIRSEEWRSLLSLIKEGVKNLVGLPEELRSLALERGKKYMLERIEVNGTLCSYYSSTFLMIFALLALGYKKTDHVITQAIAGLKSMKCEINGLPHMQYTTANVWNTALITHALQFAGVSSKDPMVAKSHQYLLSRQQQRFGDWVVHNPTSLPGGWGFSDINTFVPDVDDTTAALRSISRIVPPENVAWERGISWTLSMQNADGGWPAFEKNTDSKLLEWLPLDKAKFLLLDPSCADLTGRTLEFFGHYTNLSENHPVIKKGIRWIKKKQEKDGSWYGRWGISYLYGTWAAITGLRAVGVTNNDSSIDTAINWLRNIQNKDGGWGESCHSDVQNRYVPLGSSTVVHTAWVVDALLSASDRPTNEITRGMNYLLSSLKHEDWTMDYPNGQGMGGAFYIHYHSYRYIFPLLTLAHYQQKFGN
ncbi:squalene--hopene cyclase [Bacillus rubiinfantis]|uniref:squalene--hopene cyclase n=1 Tax=Bacillus rubiinfantis TaxID=1499680 RepID=UPI0005A83473|nr:squalene--hopene cyclase [Bacillus rubiinfantis]